MKFSKTFSITLISIIIGLIIITLCLFSLNYSNNLSYYEYIFDFSKNYFLFIGFLILCISIVLLVIYLFFTILSKKKRTLKIVLSSILTIILFFAAIIFFLSDPITGANNSYMCYLFSSIHLLTTIFSGFLLYKEVENEI